MANEVKPDRGQLRIDADECKGCGLCIEACPPKLISMSKRLNHFGYKTAVYAGAGCTGCGICFMICPEPGAITVLRLVCPRDTDLGGSHAFRHNAAEKDGATATVSGQEAIECADN
jgi:2-oxoglutarate ferredoxin oxidoreductase subunit delta